MALTKDSPMNDFGSREISFDEFMAYIEKHVNSFRAAYSDPNNVYEGFDNKAWIGDWFEWFTTHDVKDEG